MEYELGEELNTDGMVAVSYTHLDVYKRQVLMSSMLTTSFGQMRASAAEVRNPQATLTVDLDPAVNTGDIVHGAAGFLYGVSSEDVPTTNTIAVSYTHLDVYKRQGLIRSSWASR